MTQLAGALTMAIVEEFGPSEMLRRMADPWWFQAFGCVLGFDWHSSGLTTVTCGALKEAHKTYGDDLGIVVAGGKGRVSRNTPQEIASACERIALSNAEQLIYASRTSAKVDSAAVQDGFSLYHHTFLFVPNGTWCVVQQGMNDQTGWARRYHWLGERLNDFVCEPHAAIHQLVDDSSVRPAASQAATLRQLCLLNMVARESEANRKASTEIVRENPDWLLGEMARLTEGPTLFAPRRHRILDADINSKRLRKLIITAHEQHPDDFESLLNVRGVGPATVRSLSLLAEVIFGATPSHRDPASSPASFAEPESTSRRWPDYSYAHGGKDGTPFPVDRAAYDQSIAVLSDAVRRAHLGHREKLDALRRIARLETI